MQGICYFEGNLNWFCPCYKCSCSLFSSLKYAVVEKRCLMAVLPRSQIPRYLGLAAGQNVVCLLDSCSPAWLTAVFLLDQKLFWDSLSVKMPNILDSTMPWDRIILSQLFISFLIKEMSFLR